MMVSFTPTQHRYLQMLLVELKTKGLVIDESMHLETQKALEQFNSTEKNPVYAVGNCPVCNAHGSVDFHENQPLYCKTCGKSFEDVK